MIFRNQVMFSDSMHVPSTLVMLLGNATSNNQNFRRAACGNKASARHKVTRPTTMAMFNKKTIGPCRTESSYTLLLPENNFAPVAFSVSPCVLSFFALTFGDMLLQSTPRIKYFSASNPYINTLEITRIAHVVRCCIQRRTVCCSVSLVSPSAELLVCKYFWRNAAISLVLNPAIFVRKTRMSTHWR